MSYRISITDIHEREDVTVRRNHFFLDNVTRDYFAELIRQYVKISEDEFSIETGTHRSYRLCILTEYGEIIDVFHSKIPATEFVDFLESIYSQENYCL